MAKLNQVIAVEKGIKSRVYGEITTLHKASQKADLYNGFTKVYEKRDEGDENLPGERKKVVLKANDIIKDTGKLVTELLDVTATKDFANCDAKADVSVDGIVLIKDAPVSFLLFLEKQVTDIRTFIDHLPVLDEGEDWEFDSASGLNKTPEMKTHRTKKVQKPIVLYPATDKHPAQTQLVVEDIIAGYWSTVKQSGAIDAPRKQKLLERVEKLLRAVKFAREKANGIDAPGVSIGEPLVDYLFA